MGSAHAWCLLWTAAIFLSAVSAQIRVQPLLHLNGEATDPSLSPDGKTLAFDWCKPDYSCGIYTRPFAGGPVKLLVGEDRGVGIPGDLSWSPDGQFVAFTRHYSHFDVRLFVRAIAGGPERSIDAVCHGRASWSPDGRLIVAARQVDADNCLPTLYAASTGKRVRQMAAKGSLPVLAPDGQSLAYADGKAIRLLPLKTDFQPGGAPATLVREPRAISGIVWTRDGKEIIYGVWGDVSYLRRVAAEPGSHPRPIAGDRGDVFISDLLPDGSALATASRHVEALWRVNLQSATAKPQIVPNPGCSAPFPVCSPDGHQQASVSTRTGISQIEVSDSDGRHTRTLVKKIPPFVDPPDDGVPKLEGWSPDGKWIAFTVVAFHGNADDRSPLYLVPSAGGPVRRLAKNVEAIYNPVWTRDGKAIFAVRQWTFKDPSHPERCPIVRIDLADEKVTELGAEGGWPKLSTDEKFLYFFTSPYPKLYRIPVGGGSEEQLRKADDVQGFSYAVGSKYLYLIQQPPRNAVTPTFKVLRFDPETRQSSTVADVPFEPKSAQLSRDERFLYLTQQEHLASRAVLLSGF